MESYDSENPIKSLPEASEYVMPEIMYMLELLIKQDPMYTEIAKIHKTLELDVRKRVLRHQGEKFIRLPLIGDFYVYVSDFAKYTKDLHPWIFNYGNTLHIFNACSLLKVNQDTIEAARKNPLFEKGYQAFKAKYKQWKKLSVSIKEEKAQRKDYQDQVTMVIQGVNTTGQLLDVWPEVERFIPLGINKTENIQLPAVSTQRLNKFIKV